MNQIKQILPSLISDDQTGFTPNGYTGDNRRWIYNMMNYLEAKQLLGMILCLDFEKAFDSWTGNLCLKF